MAADRPTRRVLIFLFVLAPVLLSLFTAMSLVALHGGHLAAAVLMALCGVFSFKGVRSLLLARVAPEGSATQARARYYNRQWCAGLGLCAMGLEILSNGPIIAILLFGSGAALYLIEAIGISRKWHSAGGA